MTENEVQGEWPLPDGWEWTTIGEIAETTSGGTPSRKRPEYYSDGTIPWVKSGELRDGIISEVEEFITEEALGKSSAKVFPKGTPVVALYGATVGRTGILGIDAATNQAVCAMFAVDNAFTSKFITYWLQQQRANLIGLSSGGAQPNISQRIVRAFPFPLAPLPEQRRIVAEIETQFTRLDAGVAALERAQANLKRYRTSVLKGACEGRLVPQDPADEPADQLLARILAERRARWEAEHPGKRYKEPALPDTENLPKLPEGWVWASFEQLLNELKNGYFGGRPATEPPGIPILRISAVRPLSVSFEDLRYLPEVSKDKLTTYQLREGDLLFTRYNGNPHLVAACGLVRKTSDAILYPDKLIRARVSSDLILPSYLEAYFATITARYFIESRIKTTAGQYGIAGGGLKQIPVIVPPLAEQRRIVAEVELRLSVVAALEASVEAALARAARLRQSILKRAFEGRLVPQDPNDEPASVLLERIRAQWETGKKAGKTNRKKKQLQQLELL